VANDRTVLPGAWRRVKVVLPRELEDEAVGLVAVAGGDGAQTTAAGRGRISLEAWFDDVDSARAAQRLLTALEGAVVEAGEPREIRDPGWLEATLVPRGPLAAGRFVVLDRSAQLAGLAEDAIPIVLPPGRAFGTGEHATTRMCLELIGRHARPGRPTLDVGTGSAILAIAAAKLGAAPVFALDNDPTVLDVALENVNLNGVGERVTVAAGSWPQVPKGARYGLVVANIHRTAIVRGARPMARRLEPGGVAVLSGFHVEDAPRVLAAWNGAGAREVDRRQDGEWCALAMGMPD